MKLLRRLLFIVAIILIVFGGFKIGQKLNIFSPYGDIKDYNSKNIYLSDREKGKSLFEKNADKKVYPASLTKIMTVLVAVENTQDYKKIVQVDVSSYKEMVAKNASMVGFYGRENVSINDLIYGTMLASGGEAAKTLAIVVAGSEEKFVELMNAKAAELELKKTNFVNCEGMDSDGQHTTAKELAVLLEYALKNEKFREVFTAKDYLTTKSLDHPKGIHVVSTVLGSVNPQDESGFKVLGGKSGTTDGAGLCWATLIEKNSKEYIVIVMGSPIDNIKDPTMLQREDTLKLASKIK